MKTAITLLASLAIHNINAKTIEESTTGALLSFPSVMDGPLYNKTFDVSPAQFGYQQYGGNLEAVLVLPKNVTYHKECPKTNQTPEGPEPLGTNPYIHYIQDWFISENDIKQYILVIDRLDCYFVDKILYAQEMGAAGVIMCDWRIEHLFTMWMPQDWSEDIEIPSVLLSNENCLTLMQHIGVKNWDPNNPQNMEYPNVETINWTIATIEWGLPHPDDVVEYELWTSSNDYLGSQFKHNFNTTAIQLDEAGDTQFTPHMYILNGSHWGCDEQVNGTSTYPCKGQCTNRGRYCAVDPEYDLEIGLDGMDVLQENLRSLCVWEYDKQKFPGDDIMWWDYAVLWDENCGVYSNTSNNFHENCSYVQMDILKPDHSLSNYVRNKIQQTGGYGYDDGKNTMLERETKLKYNSSIYAVPMIRVNEFLIHGNIDCEPPVTVATCEVLAAICAGFIETKPKPEVCNYTPAPTVAVCDDSVRDCNNVYVIAQNVTLTTDVENQYVNGARASNLAPGTIQIVDSKWDLNILQDSDQWSLWIDMDNRWGFHPTLPSQLIMTISGNSVSPDCDMLLSITDGLDSLTLSKYFSMVVRLDGNGNNVIAPACDSNIEYPTEPLITGDVYLVMADNPPPAINRVCRPAYIDSSRTCQYETMGPASTAAQWPFTFTVNNYPLRNRTTVTFEGNGYTATGCGFGENMPVNYGHNIYITGQSVGENFQISRIFLQYKLLSTTTKAPTKNPTLNPTSNPTTNQGMYTAINGEWNDDYQVSNAQGWIVTNSANDLINSIFNGTLRIYHGPFYQQTKLVRYFYCSYPASLTIQFYFGYSCTEAQDTVSLFVNDSLQVTETAEITSGTNFLDSSLESEVQSKAACFDSWKQKLVNIPYGPISAYTIFKLQIDIRVSSSNEAAVITESKISCNPVTTTSEPTTFQPTTSEPTTLQPTTINPTSRSPTTNLPTTSSPTTINPTTINPTTISPTTGLPTTSEPTTLFPTTGFPTTSNPTKSDSTTFGPSYKNMTDQPTPAPSMRYKYLHFICYYNDNKDYIIQFVTLINYAKIMQDVILSAFRLLYEPSVNNGLTTWKRAGILDFVICHVFDTQLLSHDDIECPSYSQTVDSDDNKAEYIAIGMFEVFVDDKLNEYKRWIIKQMESNDFKTQLEDNMSDRLTNVTSNNNARRMILEYNNFEVIEIDIVDPNNITIISTINNDDLQDSNDRNSKTTTMIIVVVVCLLLVIIVFILVIYFKKVHRKNKTSAENTIEGQYNGNHIEINEMEGVQQGLTQDIDNQEHENNNVIDTINQTYDIENKDNDIVNAINQTPGKQPSTGKYVDKVINETQRNHYNNNDRDIVEAINETKI